MPEDSREKTSPYRAFVRHGRDLQRKNGSLDPHCICIVEFRAYFAGQKEK